MPQSSNVDITWITKSLVSHNKHKLTQYDTHDLVDACGGGGNLPTKYNSLGKHSFYHF